MGRGVLAVALLSGVGPINMYLPTVYGESVSASTYVSGTSRIADAAGRSLEFGSIGTFFSQGRTGTGDGPWGGRYFRADAPITLDWFVDYAAGVPTLGWLGFVNYGAMPPTDDPARLPFIVGRIWSGMSRAVPPPRAPDSLSWDQLVMNAVTTHARTPNRLVVEGTEWIRESSCGGGGCDPNIETLTSYYSSTPTSSGLNREGAVIHNLPNYARIDGRGLRPDGRPISGLAVQDVFDGLEIMCEANRAASTGRAGGCDVSSPPPILSRADLPAMRQFLLCAANEIEHQGENAIVQNVPRSIVDQWTTSTSPGAARADAGSLGAAALDVRTALTQLSGVHRSISSVIRDVESELQIVELQLAVLGSSREVLDLNTMSNALDRVTACAASSSVNGALASCANAAAQIALSLRLRDIQRETIDNEEMQLLITTLDRIQDHGDRLGEISAQVSLLLDQLNGGLTRYAAARATARRALANAALLGSDAEGRAVPLNTVLTARYGMRASRYREARQDAVRLAHIARRALEQRLGTDLADLHGLSLVEPPSDWVNLLCESSGIDYSRLRDETALPYETDEFMYVGDYIHRLEMVFESYRIDYPFQAGSGTAVVSMRDDIRGSRTSCEAESYNLVASSGNLAAPTWLASGCDPVDDGAGGTTIRSCVAAVPVDPGDFPGFTEVPADGVVEAFRVVFGGGTTGALGEEPASFTEGSRLYQEFEVARGGTYLLSWFGRVGGSSSRSPKSAVRLVGASGEVFVQSTATLGLEDPASAWTRHLTFYELPAGMRIRLEIAPNAPFEGEQTVDLAAIQLEDVSLQVTTPVGDITQALVDDSSGVYRPRPFASTNALGLARAVVCEDARGFRFREGWVPGCIRSCPSALEDGCSEAERVLRCYRETEFTITENQLERGEVLGLSGLALGNFNYRTESVGLNFVGTASRSCEDEAFPSSCYSSGFIPYSLYHYGAGGFEVRNHAGAIYRAPLFDGRIEGASALAAERYLTNPISSADRALIDPFTTRAFVGRPIPGRYVLRVWEGPGVNFEGIEDIQVVLNYRYWTRVD